MLRYPDIVGPQDRSLLNARSLPRLARSVKKLRLDRGLTQADLARRAGVSRVWVINLERGETEGIEVGRLMRVLDELDANLVIQDLQKEG
jgi:HTH-type transcriptional regulator / antitoxin HipB